MNLLHNIRRAYKILFSNSLSETPGQIFSTGAQTRAGETITEETALALSAVWCAIMLLSNTARMIPLVLMQELSEDKKQPAKTHPVYRLLRKRANPRLSASRFWFWMMTQKLSWGNGIAEIERDRAGRPLWLWPIHASRVKPELREDGTVDYRVKNDVGYNDTIINQKDIIHLLDYSRDGIWGLTPIKVGRDSMGLTAAAEAYGADFFHNAAAASGVLQRPKEAQKLEQPAINKIRASWIEHHTGPNRHAPAILQEGTTWQSISIPPEDAQFLGTRQFQIPEIGRWFHVQPHLLMDLSRATFSNIEHQDIEFRRDSASPHLVDIQDECDAKLLTTAEQEIYYAKFNMRSVMWTDHATRATYYKDMTQMGAYTINDVLRLEDMNGIGPDGDVRLVQQNLTTLDRVAAGENVGTGGGAESSLPKPQDAPKDQPADEPEPEEDGVDALLPVAIHACQRWCVRESHALARAAKRFAGNSDKFREWADKFYAESAPILAENLAPVRDAIAARGQKTEDLGAFCDWAARNHGEQAIAFFADGVIPGRCAILETSTGPALGQHFLETLEKTHVEHNESLGRPPVGNRADAVRGSADAAIIVAN